MVELDGLTDSARKRVEIAQAQATSYVWGRQDAGESDKDTGYSVDFGKAYGERTLRFVTEQTCFLPNIADAFAQWREKGEIA